MKHTAFIKFHEDLGAKMVEFAGFYMPIQYEGIITEHIHTREVASIFDTCHMGEFFISGDAKKIGLERIFTFSLEDMLIGK